MTIRNKLLAILVLICLVLSILSIGSVLSYLKHHQRIKSVNASLSGLYAVSNVRSTIINQITQSMDYLFTGLAKDKQQYQQYTLAARNAQVVWMDAIKTSHSIAERNAKVVWMNAIKSSSLIGSSESLEKHHAKEVKKNHDELTEIVESAFVLADEGKINEAYSVIEGDVRHILKNILIETVDMSVAEELRDVENSYEETLIQLGSTPWGSSKGLELVRAAKFYVTYFLMVDEVQSIIKQQYKELTDFIVGGVEEEAREFDEHGREAKAALKKLFIHIQAHPELTQGKDNNHLRDIIHVGEKHDEFVEYGHKVFELKRSGKIEEILDMRETSTEPLLNNGLFTLINNEIEQAKQEIDSANLELLDVTFNAGVKGVVLLLSISFIVMISIMHIIRGIIRPLDKFRKGTEIIGSGALDHRIGLETNDELGQLAQSFDKMSRSLQDSRDAILFAKEYTDNILRSMNDMLVVVSSDGYIIMVNDSVCALLGYGKDDLLCQPVSNIIAGGLSVKELDAEKIAPNVTIRNVEKKYMTKDGRKVPVLFSSSVMHDKTGQVEGIVCAAQDITEQKEAEENLLESERTLRRLASQILTAQEKERRRISIGLHDDLCQSMSLLKLQFGAVKDDLRDDQALLKEDCSEILYNVDNIIENIRRLSRDLSPALLEDLGLSAAIRWLINDFVNHYDVRMVMDIEDIDNLYDRDTQIILYRIFQESLANIGKHSGASHISAFIRKNGKNTFFQLEDDGKGFDLNRVLGKKSTQKGMGLTAMYERARMVGATLDIWSQKGKGTRISFTVPSEKLILDRRRV